MTLRLPHPLVLLLGGVLVAAVMTWVLPAVSYDRAQDPDLGALDRATCQAESHAN